MKTELPGQIKIYAGMYLHYKQQWFTATLLYFVFQDIKTLDARYVLKIVTDSVHNIGHKMNQFPGDMHHINYQVPNKKY